MKISEIKEHVDYLQDVLYQAGYDLGWEQAIEDLEQLADAEWNRNNKTTAEVLRKAIKTMKGEDWDDAA